MLVHSNVSTRELPPSRSSQWCCRRAAGATGHCSKSVAVVLPASSGGHWAVCDFLFGFICRGGVAVVQRGPLGMTSRWCCRRASGATGHWSQSVAVVLLACNGGHWASRRGGVAGVQRGPLGTLVRIVAVVLPACNGGHRAIACSPTLVGDGLKLSLRFTLLTRSSPAYASPLPLRFSLRVHLLRRPTPFPPHPARSLPAPRLSPPLTAPPFLPAPSPLASPASPPTRLPSPSHRPLSLPPSRRVYQLPSSSPSLAHPRPIGPNREKSGCTFPPSLAPPRHICHSGRLSLPEQLRDDVTF